MSSIKKGKCIDLNWFLTKNAFILKKTSNYCIYKMLHNYKIYMLYYDKLQNYIVSEIDRVEDLKEVTKVFNDEMLKEIVKNKFEVV